LFWKKAPNLLIHTKWTVQAGSLPLIIDAQDGWILPIQASRVQDFSTLSLRNADDRRATQALGSITRSIQRKEQQAMILKWLMLKVRKLKSKCDIILWNFKILHWLKTVFFYL